MDHEELKDKLLKAMGGAPPMKGREVWGEFVRSRGSRFYMSYDWIKDRRIWDWAADHPDVVAEGGANGVVFEIIGFGRKGHERS
jgi:hypothetical protein